MFTGDVSYTSGGAGSVGLAPSIDQIVAWDYLDRGLITNPLRKSLSIKITGSSFRAPSVSFSDAGRLLARPDVHRDDDSRHGDRSAGGRV
jgi:hypothetical protein